MTLELTPQGHSTGIMDPVAKETEDEKMTYTMDEGKLLRVWTVITCFSQIREIQDPVIQSEILTNAQILLTAFVLELQPLPGDQTSSVPRRTSLDQTVTFDA